MEANSFYVDKISDTSADTLLAVGFASLLGAIHEKIYQTMDGIFICDLDSCYRISLPQPITEDNLSKIAGIYLVQPLDSQKQREKKGKKTIDGFDYDKAMEDSRAYRARVKELPPELQTSDARLKRAPGLVEIIDEEPETNTRLGHYQAINQMKIAGTFNELVLRWSELTEEQMRWHVGLLLDLFSHPDNDIAKAVTIWQQKAKVQGIAGKALVTALQIVNPTTGKGANREKARELTIGNQDSFWLLELLKFKGFMDASSPVVIKESKDRKTYVLQPRLMELGRLQYIMKEFRASFWSTTAIKLDILASLRFAQVLVEQYKISFQRSLLPNRRQIVASIAQGFEVTSYKDLGSAYATMNVAKINLPLWLPELGTREHVKEAEDLLNEHVQIIQGIRNSKGEEGSEEYELLRFYRNFLSGHDLRPFWKFTTTYASYLMSQHEHEKNPKRHIRQLSYEGLETVIMNTQGDNTRLMDITSNPGFQHIAKAIRYSTVIPQREKARGEERVYEIRYGLGQELMRKARYRDEFMTAISEFLHLYNAENARVEEKAKDGKRPRYFRSNVVYTDIDDIAQLVDKFKSPELICSMLVAYGYAANPRKAGKPDVASGASDALPSDDEE